MLESIPRPLGKASQFRVCKSTRGSPVFDGPMGKTHPNVEDQGMTFYDVVVVRPVNHASDRKVMEVLMVEAEGPHTARVKAVQQCQRVLRKEGFLSPVVFSLLCGKPGTLDHLIGEEYKDEAFLAKLLG